MLQRPFSNADLLAAVMKILPAGAGDQAAHRPVPPPDHERRGEQTIRNSELSYRRLFEAAQDGILILDVDTGVIHDVNPFLSSLLGFSHEELVSASTGDHRSTSCILSGGIGGKNFVSNFRSKTGCWASIMGSTTKA